MIKIFLIALLYVFALEGVISTFLSFCTMLFGNFTGNALYVVVAGTVMLEFFGFSYLVFLIKKLLLKRLEELEADVRRAVAEKEKITVEV